MLTPEAKKELEDQQYRIAGSHSAVKICHWTKKKLREEGECYKHSFYGINSHLCLQMSTSLSCANRCVFCWRGFKSPVSKEWKWDVDDPKEILEQSIHEHVKLLLGFGGNDKVNKELFEEAKNPKHVALSLTGEPITYPKINEFIEESNKKGISTFLVTNGQYPEQVKDLNQVTQLYISVDAPTKELMKEIDVPLFADYWERFEKSLEYLSQKKGRTAIRITLVTGMNDSHEEEYAEIIKKGNPDFLEIKGYAFVGASRQRLKIENMPIHEQVIEFGKEIEKLIPEYEIMAEHVSSRVILLAKKKFKTEEGWNTWIDFDKWNELITNPENKGEISTEDYWKATPKEFIGLSGKGTKDNMSPEQLKKFN